MKRVRASLQMMALAVAASAAMAVPGSAGWETSAGTAQVETCLVQRGSVEQILALTGNLRYETEYAAISPTTGVVAQVYVRAGDPVSAGQPLFRLKEDAQAAAVSAALCNLGAVDNALEINLPAIQLQEASAALESLTVRAAADGVVQQVNISRHGGVMAGTAAVALSAGEQVIRCSAVLRDAGQLRTGMQARILRDDELLTQAVVKEVAPAQVNTATGQTVCQVTLTPQKGISLPLGATVDVEVILYGQKDVPVLPLAALSDNSTVWWVADGRCYEIPVQEYMADEVNCWVSLPEGEQVVLRGNVQQGQRVQEAER